MVPSGHTRTDAPPREMGVEDPLLPGQQLQPPPALRFLKYHSPESPQRRSRLKTGRHQVTLCMTFVGLQFLLPGLWKHQSSPMKEVWQAPSLRT
ncbi:hypothetical protein LEMLEM_LOCUS20172 [Lemmus lemmus]